MPYSPGTKWYWKIIFPIALIVLIPIILIVVVPFLCVYFLRRYWLLLQVWREWVPRGKRVLLVYSDNPEWKQYVELTLVPQLQPHVVLLNWSEKNTWKHDDVLEVKLFRHFYGNGWLSAEKLRLGGQEFNHVAIVFRPWHAPHKVRFWSAWKEHTFGKEEALRRTEKKLVAMVTGPTTH